MDSNVRSRLGSSFWISEKAEIRLRGSAFSFRTGSVLPPTTTTTSKSERRSWASFQEIWEPMMTP